MGKKISKKGKSTKQAPKDFVKDKRKVGKKRKAPQNETKTDFRVKQVQMPSQSALDEKGEEVTHRRLGLAELLAHMQHHSRKVRRDALLGLQELCSAHDGVLRGNLARIFEATSAAPIDDCAEVRGAFRKLQSWLLQSMPEDATVAFAPTMALHVRSSLSHVSAEVRADGLTLLEMYLAGERGNLLLGQEEAARVIETLCQLTSHTDAVLKCLHRLLEAPSGDHAGAGRSRDGDSNGAPPQVPLLTVVGSSPSAAGGEDAAANAAAAASPGAARAQGAASPVWGFCLRAWLQAGELPPSGRGASALAAARPGLTRLRCASVLERALERSGLPAMRGEGASVASCAQLRPSRAQLATLAALVKRGEWPLVVEPGSPYEALASSVNLRMARVFALLALGGMPADAPMLRGMVGARLARAALGALEGLDGARLAASRGGSIAASPEAADVQLLDGASAVAYAFRSLELLWACAPGGASESGVQLAPDECNKALGCDDIRRLVSATASLSRGRKQTGSEAEAMLPRVQSMPLVATLLGLQPGRAVGVVPAKLRLAWPQALCGASERSFAEEVELAEPGLAASWVSEWPKLLFYLGASDAALSAFILTLLLQLAKRASRVGSLHEKLFRGVCPLLVPFLAGAAGAEGEPPPLARLPPETQGLAPLLLRYFPKLGRPLVSALARLVCRWSALGAPGAGGEVEGAAGPYLGVECCKVLLEAILLGGNLQEASPLQLRLAVVVTVLSAAPPAALDVASARAGAAERAALHFADVFAECLMGGGLLFEGDGLAADAEGATLGCDNRRRLVLQTIAWQVCRKVLAASPALGPRALCFLFFCALRLPVDAPAGCGGGAAGASATAPAELGWQRFLSSVFDGLVLSGDGCLAQASIGTALEDELCESTRFGRLPYCGLGASGAEGPDIASRRLARMFVATWLLSVAGAQRPAAYELLVKRCTCCLLAAASASEASPDELPAAALLRAAGGSALVLAQAAAHRNELSLPTGGWPTPSVAEAVDASVASKGALEVRVLLAELAKRPRLRMCVVGLQELAEVLPLL